MNSLQCMLYPITCFMTIIYGSFYEAIPHMQNCIDNIWKLRIYIDYSGCLSQKSDMKHYSIGTAISYRSCPPAEIAQVLVLHIAWFCKLLQQIEFQCRQDISTKLRCSGISSTTLTFKKFHLFSEGFYLFLQLPVALINLIFIDIWFLIPLHISHHAFIWSDREMIY